MVGLGIAAMHYCGIAALEIDGRILFHVPLFVLSALLGVDFAMLSFMAHRWIDHQHIANPSWYWRLLPPARHDAGDCQHALHLHACHAY